MNFLNYITKIFERFTNLFKLNKDDQETNSVDSNDIYVTDNIRKYISSDILYRSSIIKFLRSLYVISLDELSECGDFIDKIMSRDGAIVPIQGLESEIKNMVTKGECITNIRRLYNLTNLSPDSEFDSYYHSFIMNKATYEGYEPIKLFEFLIFTFYGMIYENEPNHMALRFAPWYSEDRKKEEEKSFVTDQIKFIFENVTSENIFNGVHKSYLEVAADMNRTAHTHAIKVLELLSKLINNNIGMCVDFASDYQNALLNVKDTDIGKKNIPPFIFTHGKVLRNRGYTSLLNDLTFAKSSGNDLRITTHNGVTKYISMNDINICLCALTHNPFMEAAPISVIYSVAVFIHYFNEAESMIENWIFEQNDKNLKD